jgi:sigma-B regulation protein RsbU (phosphoserine phosphatase)
MVTAARGACRFGKQHRQAPGVEAVVTVSGQTLSRLRVLAALAFGAATLFYAATWIYYAQQGAPEAVLGITYEYDGWRQGLCINEVVPESPAERVGIKPGDLIVAVNGQLLSTPNPFSDSVVRGKPGDSVRLTVARGGGPSLAILETTLARRPPLPARPDVERLALYPLHLFPVPFVLVGLAVLALRVHDRNAWLLALSFAALGTGATEVLETTVHPSLRNATFAYAVLFSGTGPAFFYALLARFPAPSSLDRLVPWLKTGLLVFASSLWIPLAISTLAMGSAWPALRLLTAPIGRVLDTVVVTYIFGAIGLGLVSLFLNCRRSVEVEARRKARLVVWSFTIGFLPVVLMNTVALYFRKGLFELPFWFWVPCALLVMLLPVLFGYAVVRHRVLGLSVLVRRSARYLLVQRGFLLLALMLSIAVTALFVSAIARVLPRLTNATLPAGIAVGTLFGLVLFRTGGAVASRVTRRIDHAFFRSAYDARLILEELAQHTALATSRDELASLLERELHEALHPRLVVIYLRDQARVLRRFSRAAGRGPESLEEAPELVARFERDGRPVDAFSGPEVSRVLAALEAECAVPMLTRRRKLVGLLAVGPRLSDELYSREDSRLLASIASQAGSALENLMLAEEMARRIEAERRAEQELQIAAQVQRRLLPRKIVAMTTIEYAGHCVQARAVGGDYYDFLGLGQGRLGLVLGDVSGKGLYAALLTTHLQASLRSLSARLAAEDLAALLEDVNRSFCESTAGNHFATIFIGHYQDHTRRLRYANCGHIAPVLLRNDGSVERLGVTAGAIGLFEEWTGSAADVVLNPGDVLAMFSDGVTEAIDREGEEFGEARLLDVLAAHRRRPIPELMDLLIGAVRAFSGAEQSDDLTLVIVRGR